METTTHTAPTDLTQVPVGYHFAGYAICEGCAPQYAAPHGGWKNKGRLTCSACQATATGVFLCSIESPHRP